LFKKINSDFVVSKVQLSPSEILLFGRNACAKDNKRLLIKITKIFYGVG
jgi:hypothetical protein